MKGKQQFTDIEADGIRRLLRQKSNASRKDQKRIRSAMRRIGFYITDFTSSLDGFSVDDFESLIRHGHVVINKSSTREQLVTSSTNLGLKSIITTKDEAYIIDLCDEVLGKSALRQHRFDFLNGDAGTSLPVDAYYPSLNLVIEYRERQHMEAVDFFDKPDRLTVSGVHRGEQRRIYDQRRRDLLPQHAIDLIELSYTDFAHAPDKRLLRRRDGDKEVVRHHLAQWIK